MGAEPVVVADTNVLSEVRACCEIVVPEETVSVITRDPGDNRVLECAKAARAEWIVSGDQDLLHLESFEGVPIVTARELLDRLAGRNRIE